MSEETRKKRWGWCEIHDDQSVNYFAQGPMCASAVESGSCRIVPLFTRAEFVESTMSEKAEEE